MVVGRQAVSKALLVASPSPFAGWHSCFEFACMHGGRQLASDAITTLTFFSASPSTAVSAAGCAELPRWRRVLNVEGVVHAKGLGVGVGVGGSMAD